MLDNNFERERSGDAPEERAGRPADDTSPLADREVPLAPVAASDVIHRWLDGEIPEPVGLRGESAGAVEFWRRIGEESERRRQVATPPYVAAQIMASLPERSALPAATPWWKQDVHLSPVSAGALLAGAFVLGLIVMRLLAAA